MELKLALAVAAVFAGDENPRSCVKLYDRRVRAMGAISGVDIGVDFDLPGVMVNAKATSKIVAALDGEVKLSVVKGRKLSIRGGGSKYRVQAIPESAEPEFPEPPTKGWTDLSEQCVAALLVLDKMASGEGPLAGVRLTPEWAASGNMGQVAVSWGRHVPYKVTVPQGFVKGLSGACTVASEEGRRFWVRDGEGNLRWTQTLSSEWPDAHLGEMVSKTRAHRARIESQVDIGALAALANRAHAICDAKASGFLLSVGDRKITLTGGDDGRSYGAVDFEGDMEIDTDGEAKVGVTGFDLQRVTSLLAGLPGPHWIAVADPTVPMCLWCGEGVVVEAMTVPTYL